MVLDSLSRDQLDASLAPAVQDPETFPHALDALVTQLGDVDLELRDPNVWKKPESSEKRGRIVSFLRQFQLDVARIERLKRDEEGRLARAIEFAKLRLEREKARHGIEDEELERRLAHPGAGWGLDAARQVIERSDLPPKLARRWVELHALRTEMVERNLFLVPLNVERYARTGASRIDLIQEGCIALYRAVDGFDWRRGLLFRTYAVHWLAQAFRDHLYNFSNVIRVPIYVQKAMHRAAQERGTGAPPSGTAEELAEEAGLSERAAHAARGILRGSLSLEMEDRTGSRLADVLEDTRIYPQQRRMSASELGAQIERAFETLTNRERIVLGQRFGLGCDHEATLAEVAKKLKLSIERVRQIQAGALGKLAAPRVRRQFEVFLMN